jgi:hypothetical protein
MEQNNFVKRIFKYFTVFNKRKFFYDIGVRYEKNLLMLA